MFGIMVMVYDFTGWSPSMADIARDKCKMTAKAIERHGLTRIELTGEHVPVDKIDSEGRYYPDAKPQRPGNG